MVDELDAAWGNLPSGLWTPEEMKTLGIRENTDETRRVSLEEIEQTDTRDKPSGSHSIASVKTEQGLIETLTITSRYTSVPEEDLAAWRDRCAARRALYDAKEAAFWSAYAASGLDAMNERYKDAEDGRVPYLRRHGAGGGPRRARRPLRRAQGEEISWRGAACPAGIPNAWRAWAALWC